jgi:hypothetical protein
MKSIDRIAYSLGPLRLRLRDGDAIEPRLLPVPQAPEGSAPRAPEGSAPQAPEGKAPQGPERGTGR